MTEEIYDKWFKDEGDITHRLNYPLNENSLVFDVGGYMGNWADLIIQKYNCNIYIFEPVSKHYDHLVEKFKDKEKIKIFHFGLSDETKEIEISTMDDSSSIYKDGENKEIINLKDIYEFITENNIKVVNLIKLNCEGEEYNILNRIHKTKIQNLFIDIQIQFHLFVPGAKNKRKVLRNSFFKTHKETYCYDFVWENWTKKRDLYFFNLFHNGDIHFSRRFVGDLINKTTYTNYYFLHTNKIGILKDINLTEIIDKEIVHDDFFYKPLVNNKNADVYINTWIGQSTEYSSQGVNLSSTYKLWKDIYDRLNIKIEEMDFYFPSIDYSKVEKEEIDEFLSNHKRSKVLICNGEVLSEQSDAVFDINKITETFPEIDFILTTKTDIIKDNIYYTDDIIKVKPDLCEISYLSTFCDVIIGRESGPFSYCYVKDNMNKKMISFSRSQGFTYYHGKNVISSQQVDTYPVIRDNLSNETIKISIVTGTLNRIEPLKRLIENTVNRSERIELILLDGGSTDGTIEYVKSLNNHRIQFVEIGGRSSYPSYMNIGLGLAKADWIAQWNDDVLLISDWEEVIHKLYEGYDVYIFDWTRGTIEDFENKNYERGWINFHDCMNFGIYRKSIFKEIGMYDPKFKYYECDHDMTTRCLYFGYKISNCSDIKVMEIWKSVGDMTEKRAIDHQQQDRMLWFENLNFYQSRRLPSTIQKLN